LRGLIAKEAKVLSTPFQSNEVADTYAAYPQAIRERALHLRALIFEVAKKTPGVGHVEETLKWSEPAYIAYAGRAERIIGSAVRIGWKKSDPDRYRLLFHCQTTLVDSFRERIPNVFTFEGNRAIVFGVDDKIPERATAQCIATSLTYRLSRKSG
jgi:Domain of unknown function (DU1801)